MTLLDAARQLNGQDVTENFDRECPFCGISDSRWPMSQPFPHQDDCPWLAMPRIVRALEAADTLLAAVSRIDGHYRRELPVHGKPGETVAVCSDCDSQWPCDVAHLGDPANALRRLLDPDACREDELLTAYLDYIGEQAEQGVQVERQPQRPGESRTAWFTRLLESAGVPLPAEVVP